MSRLTQKSQQIRNHIIRLVREGNPNPSDEVASTFSISKQAVNKHISALVDDDFLIAQGETKNRTYRLGTHRENGVQLPLKHIQGEDQIYRQSFDWICADLPTNVNHIIFYGFTEMVNNAIDHSEGKNIAIHMKRNDKYVSIFVMDDGEGIFKRIARLCQLPDERQSLLELAKGKLTTDPQNHTGQGVFFTSRMFDDFVIQSKGLRFDHHDQQEFDVLREITNHELEHQSTIVAMRIAVDSPKIDSDIFDAFSSDDDYSFNRTIVPVKLAQYGQEQLISRSQAKRVLVRVEHFKYVVFDFEKIDSIGQAFADQIFRVYSQNNPDIQISYENAVPDVVKMIKRANPTILSEQEKS